MTTAILTVTVIQSVVLVVLAVTYRQSAIDWRAERRELLNRIKPETAQHPDTPAVPVKAVDLEDDEAVWDTLNERAGVSAGGSYR